MFETQMGKGAAQRYRCDRGTHRTDRNSGTLESCQRLLVLEYDALLADVIVCGTGGAFVRQEGFAEGGAV
jgi:hypothetical protein